jgi:hypothetical protein
MKSLPTHEELAQWSDEQYLSFFALCRVFISEDEAHWKVTPERRREAEALADPFSRECLERLAPADADDKQLYYRLMTMVRLVLGYLKDRQERVTEALRAAIEHNPRLNWCLAGNPAVVEARPLSPEMSRMAAHIKTVEIYHRLADSFTDKEIARMSAKDKLLAMGRLLPSLNGMKHQPKRPNPYASLDIKTATVKELEEVMLYYAR